MKKKSLYILWVILISTLSSNAQMGTLRGFVYDKQTKERIPFANILVEDSINTISSVSTDFDGNYVIKNIAPGIYRVNVVFVGYSATQINQVKISPDTIRFLDISLQASAEMLDEVIIVDYKIPLITKDQTASGASITANDMSRMPNRSASVSVKAAGAYSQDRSRGSVRGARSNQTAIFIDGIRVDNNSNVPQSAIEEMEEMVQDAENDINTKAKLTATEINDFSKWELWNDLQKTQLRNFRKTWEIAPESRYCVQVMSQDNKPVVDAEVFLLTPNDSIIWQARTDNTGKAELWAQMFRNEGLKNLIIQVVNNKEIFTYENPQLFRKGINVLKINADCDIPNEIDIAFVVDATGSMGDEIDFLKTDLIDIIQHTSENFPESSINLGSVFYRCFNNSYVTKASPLSSNIKETVLFIRSQNAGEGGDEVVEEAFMAAVDDLDWSPSARARLLFFVLDEQPVINQQVIKKIQHYTQKAAKKGIRVIPIVASAENDSHAKSLEYLMRSIALATNGTSVFLTDHSQIGNAHTAPTTDQYDVELLNSLMKRIIFQFSYVTECDEEISAQGVSDTTYLFESRIIANEIVDTSKITLNTPPPKRIQDFTQIADSATDSLAADSMPADQQDQNTDSRIEEPLNIKYYPNPTSGKVIVEIKGKIETLYLVDISGKIVLKFNPKTDERLTIDLDNYSNGLYFLKFHHTDGWHTSKVILSR